MEINLKITIFFNLEVKESKKKGHQLQDGINCLLELLLLILHLIRVTHFTPETVIRSK